MKAKSLLVRTGWIGLLSVAIAAGYGWATVTPGYLTDSGMAAIGGDPCCWSYCNLMFSECLAHGCTTGGLWANGIACGGKIYEDGVKKGPNEPGPCGGSQTCVDYKNRAVEDCYYSP